MNRVLTAIVLAFLAPVWCFAQMGMIELGTPDVQGGTIRVPVTLSGDVGSGVSAMDFRFRYDPEVFEPVGIAAGEAAASAQKLVQANVVRPGEYVVLMFGINQETVLPGEVAEITLRMLDDSLSGQSEIRVSNTTISLANATDMPSGGSSMTVRFGESNPGDSPATPPENPTEPSEEPAPADPEEPQAPPPVLGAPSSGKPNGTATASSENGLPQDTGTQSSRPATVQTDALKRQQAAADALRSTLPRGGAGEAALGSSAADDSDASGTGATIMNGTATAAGGVQPSGTERGISPENASTRAQTELPSPGGNGEEIAESGEISITRRNGTIAVAMGVGGVILLALYGLRRLMLR